jgi:hypothetical protein
VKWFGGQEVGVSLEVSTSSDLEQKCEAAMAAMTQEKVSA